MRNNISGILMFAALILCGILVVALINGPKCINTEQEMVEVTIVDEYHRSSYMTPMRVGKITTMQTHPAVYRITVEYNGEQYTVSGRDTYNRYKEKIGATTTGTLEIRTYENGTVRYDIVALE